jgi:hypothetical protein
MYFKFLTSNLKESNLKVPDAAVNFEKLHYKF